MTTELSQNMCQKIISGGQTGVDRGTLDACLENNFFTGGWCPKGRLAEDGSIDVKYPLTETFDTDYKMRTLKNIEDSDATLSISNRKLYGGTLFTFRKAIELKKPVWVVISRRYSERQMVNEIIKWINENSIYILNVAGPRESDWEEGYEFSKKLIQILIHEIHGTICLSKP